MKQIFIGVLLCIMLTGCNGDTKDVGEVAKSMYVECKGTTTTSIKATPYGTFVEVTCKETIEERNKK